MPDKIRTDLHVHTCLSPCGELAATPAAMVARAKELGLGIISICDHNTCENVPAAREAARRLGPGAPLVLAGMEVTSAEEAHLVIIFQDYHSALVMQAMVYDHLQEGENDPVVFGYQIVANADDEVEEMNPRLLIGATDLPVEEIVRRGHSLGGLVIASHLDRPGFSLVGQLGMIPPGLPLDAVEISPRGDPHEAGRWLMGSDYPVITASDCHHPDQLGSVWTEFWIEGASLAELVLAMRGEKGRGISGWGRREAP